MARAFEKERAIPLAYRPWLPLKPTLSTRPLPEGEEQFANGHYVVHRRKFFIEEGPNAGEPAMIYLSLRTVENTSRHDWREYQRIKNELAGPEWWAIEVYPSEDDLHDGANQFHLWCFPERPRVYLPLLEVISDFGFTGRDVLTPEQLAADPETDGLARQRPFWDQLFWPGTTGGPGVTEQSITVDVRRRRS